MSLYRSGTSLVEALVALLLGVFLMHLGLTTLRRLDDFEDRARRRHDAMLAARIAHTVLRSELDRGRAGFDWFATEDSLVLRAFRGTGVVCDLGTDPNEVSVAYLGDRRPDPSKDSVEITRRDGTDTRVALEADMRAASPCGMELDGETTRVWRLSAPVPADAVVARIYESGSYHLSGAALRYRVGRGGRQPLTPDVWQDVSTGLYLVDSGVGLTLTPLPGFGAPRSGFLSWARP